MKKIQSILLALCLLLVCALVVQAGQVYDRSSVTTAAATGYGTVAPEARYAGLVLKKVWVYNAAVNSTTTHVYRVVSGGTVTQEVATVGLGAVKLGSAVPAEYAAIKSGETFLVFTEINGVGTNATALLDYEVQTHD